jgi:hypothetical protein
VVHPGLHHTICKDCYAFANHHRYLENHTMGCNDDDGEDDGNGDGNGDGDDNNDADGGNGEGKHSNDGRSNDGNNDDGSKDFSDVGVHPIRNIDLNCLNVASTKADEERELMLLQAAAHIKMDKGTESPLPGQGGACSCRCNCKERILGKKIYFCC